MILQPHGVIAQAGGIVWNNGGTHDYRNGASPVHPEANFVRDVDFCAPAFLLVRTTLLSQLDGLDHECAPGYESVDLCLRIAAAGFRVVYDPTVMITLGETAPPRGEPNEHFLSKHAAALENRFASGGPVQVFARHASASRSLAGQSPPNAPPASPRRILFIEDTVPLRRIGSGFVRANDLIRVIAAQGYAVTVFPLNGCNHDLARVFGDMPESVEVMHTLSRDHLAAFLTARPGYYDTVWVARTHNLAQVRPILARSMAEGTLTARIVLDTEAITPNREAMQAQLTGEPYDLQGAMQTIMADAAVCQQTVAVTEAEAETLRALGFPRVSVVGHMIEPNPTARPFAQRAGMLFVGAIHKQDSPNLDSLVWFVDTVLPLIEAELKWETRLTIAGYVAAGIDLSRFEHHPRITMRGPVADLGPLYNAHRVFVAPTRYAAGAPYKVLEAASRGVPVVATEVLREQLGWSPGQDIMAAGEDDPERLAAHIVTLHRDETLWQSVREGALHRLAQENKREEFVRSVVAVLTQAADDGGGGGGGGGAIKTRPVPKIRHNS
jgi:O-antigen biosynthesis protein